MPNVMLIMEYDGGAYFGFQKQPNLPTIQGELERVLSDLVFLESPIYCAGRTDAGVHARGQVINFRASTRVPINRLPAALNARLPSDIVIKHGEVVPDDFHARKSALKREYRYYIHNAPHPPAIGRQYCYHYPLKLDIRTINQGMDLIKGIHDFSSFCRVEEGKSYHREIYEASCQVFNDYLVVIRVVANAFAYMMMRMLCGSLLEVGRGRWSVPYFHEVLQSRDNSLSAPALPPHGLVLERVYYQ